MEDRDNGSAPGWYPAPDGTQRYWDGAQWLSIPPPDSSQSGSARPRGRSRRTWALVGVAVVLVTGLLVGVGVAVKMDRDRELAAAEEAAIAEEVARAEAAEEAARAQAADDEAEAQRAQEQREDRERDQRQEAMADIEVSVEMMAEEHAEDGIIEGPVLAVSCSPVAGGSIDDITEQTTVFDCFVGTEDHGDGTMSGFSYNATMNWSTGSYTYGIGSP